jgi:hypothetical protein
MFKVFAKSSKAYVKEFYELKASIDLYKSSPRDYISYIINVVKVLAESKKEKLLIHNHTIQRECFILLHYSSLGERTITTMHYDPPFHRILRMLPKAYFGGRLIAISRNQYQRLKQSLSSALIRS